MRRSTDDKTTEAAISGSVMAVGKGIMVAVIMLIVLGELYATGIVAEPWADSVATDRVNETYTGSTGDLIELNTSADYYYDNSTNKVEAEVVTNQTTGTVLTEGTDYQFYSNGTVELISADATEVYVEYSTYTRNAFETMILTFGDYGSVAFTMIGLGLIAAGAAAALRYFGGFGGGR